MSIDYYFIKESLRNCVGFSVPPAEITVLNLTS